MCEVHALIALAVCATVLEFAIGIPCGVALAKRRG
jgi:ABC-type dipeptide/oligopeptide/nickel transport system permease component